MNLFQKVLGHLTRFPLFRIRTSWIILVLVCLLSQITTLNYVELQPTSSDVKRSQILSFKKGEIDNYYNYQYYARMELGNPPQKFDVILDTGSHLLWVPSISCKNCPNDYRKFDSQASNTTVPLPLREHIRYGRGQVQGYYVMQNVFFQGLTSRMNMLLVDKQEDTEHSQADGIMGLSNFRAVKNVLDIAYKNNQLLSAKFAFQLGRKELKQKSYFIYNISQEDYTEAVYINATDRDYWNIPVREMSLGDDLVFKNKKALVDSGTSLILVPQYMFQRMDENIFKQYCTKVLWSSSRRCKCPHEVTYPNLTVLSSSLQFNITPQSYITGAYNRRNCMLGIQAVPSDDIDVIILGDVFFHDKTIVFDKKNNKIGFISNSKNIFVYPQEEWVLYIFDAIALLGIASAVAVLMMRKKKLNGKSELSEGLRIGGSGQMQMAGVE